MAVTQDQRWQKDAADQNFDYMFKLLIIGNSSVGKTSFLFRYADDSFTSAFVSTVGIDFKVKTVFRNDKRVKLQIWVSECELDKRVKLQIWVSECELRPYHTEKWAVKSSNESGFQVGMMIFVTMLPKCTVICQYCLSKNSFEEALLAYVLKFLFFNVIDLIYILQELIFVISRKVVTDCVSVYET